MNIFQDFKFLRGNKKGYLFAIFFRISNFFARSNKIIKLIGFPFRIIYLFFIQWIMCIDVPDRIKVGPGFNVWHGMGLVIHPDVVIGNNFIVRHTTTIGQKRVDQSPPIIGDNVDVGAHSIIVGNIRIGNNVTIGAATFVNKDVPDNCIVYGNPMVIKQKV